MHCPIKNFKEVEAGTQRMRNDGSKKLKCIGDSVLYQEMAKHGISRSGATKPVRYLACGARGFNGATGMGRSNNIVLVNH